MKRLFLLIYVVFISIILSGCTLSDPTDFLEDEVIDEINHYININDLIERENDEKLTDVEEQSVYLYEDFFNFENKDSRNVELEYGEFHSAFRNLIFVKDVISNIDDFEYKTYFEEVIENETIYVSHDDDELYIDYYESMAELEVIMRHTYILKTVDAKAVMTKYLNVYDTDSDEILVTKKMIVREDLDVELFEYYPNTGSFTYIYNSKEDQEYFKYKGTLKNDTEYLRQTVEFYIPQHWAYVSYDIKDETLEDYRIKLFRDGHRIVKIDVNVFNSNPTINELTWNLLEVSGWDSVEKTLEKFYVYQDNFSILNDYDITLQLNGYGKIIAYKEFEGELVDADITLSEYGLDSGLNLVKAYQARDYFIDNYISEAEQYGFTVTSIDDLDIIIIAEFIDYNDSGMFDEYIDENK